MYHDAIRSGQTSTAAAFDIPQDVCLIASIAYSFRLYAGYGFDNYDPTTTSCFVIGPILTLGSKGPVPLRHSIILRLEIIFARAAPRQQTLERKPTLLGFLVLSHLMAMLLLQY